MLARLVAVAALGLAAPQEQAPQQDGSPQSRSPASGGELATFQNYNRTFQLELPKGWRQVAPNEAVKIGEMANSPQLVRSSGPRSYYAVGPIDQWLQGNFNGPWLNVIEQRLSWHIDDDYEEFVRTHWREQGPLTGLTYDIASVVLEKLGTQQVECVVADRTVVAKDGTRTRWLDVHAPTGSQKIVMSFTCAENEFARWQPEFRRWLDTLTFARVPDEPATLGDRLWTPILVGGAVGLVLLLLYRHTRARR